MPDRLRRSAWIGALATLGVVAGGCVRDRSTLSPAGPAARRLADLGWPVLVFFSVTTILCWGLLAWAALRRRGTLAEHAPADTSGGTGWILVGGVVIPALSFGAIFVTTLNTMAAFPMSHEHRTPDVRIVGHQWWWEIHYVMGDLTQRTVTANELHLPVGRPMAVDLVSYDVIHSLWVPRLHGKVDLVPGQVNHIQLQADQPGVYPGACAELCGMQHANMRLLVVAEPAAEFDAWLARQREPALQPASPDARHGSAVFARAACPLCHTVRGTGALATVGPDLTHVGSRHTIAAGALPNDVGTLHAWIVDAPSLKPGVRMPAMNEFDGVELHDLVAYLRGLE